MVKIDNKNLKQYHLARFGGLELSSVVKQPAASTIRRYAVPAVALVVFAVNLFVHLGGLFSNETREVFRTVLDLPLRVLLLLALADGISRLRTPSERRFWALTLAAFSAWFIADIAFQPEGNRSLLLSLLEDGAFLLFYPLLMIAVEQRPCRYHWPITGWGSRWLCAAAGLGVILWSYIYFVELTMLFEPAAFLSATPSYVFFCTADFVFAAVFLIRMFIARGRWQVIYALFGAALFVWGVTDLLDALGLIGVEVVNYGTPLDVVWSLPYFAIIAAATYRNRSVESAVPIPATTTHSATLVVSAYAYASVIPIIHFVVFRSGWLREIEVQRELTVVIGLVILFGIALSIQARERRRRKIIREPWITIVEDEEQQVQKMEALGRLAGGVAHDFNNLLMVLQSEIDIRRNQLATLPDGPDFVSQVETVVRRGSDLSRQLLAFGRKQVSRTRVIAPDETVKETQSLLRRTLGAHVDLALKTGPDVWPVAIDPGQLTQILINLALNARAAMPEGGRLDIGVGNVVIDHGGSESDEPNQFVQIEVTDNGRGMDEQTRSRVFEPFFSKRSPTRGTGLGLAVAYGIVKQHGGHITCESAEDQGTTFRIHLPRSHRPKTEQPEEIESARTGSGGAETILLAEDEPTVRSLTAEYLSDLGYRVIEAADGAAALEQAQSFDGTIDLLVTDVVMPKIGGRELADTLVSDRPSTAVLFVSGYPQDLSIDGQAGTNQLVLEKPYSLVDLEAAIRRTLDRT